MKKKILHFVLIAVVVLSLAACGAASIPGEERKLGTGLVEEKASAAVLDENPYSAAARSPDSIRAVPAEMLDGTLLSEEFYYYRNTLDDTSRQAYDLIRSHLLKGTEKFQMRVPVKRGEIFDIYKKVIYDSPEIFWAEVNGSRYAYNKRGYVTAFMPGYNDLARDIKGSTRKLEKATSEALADMWSLDSDAEKAKYAHDWLCCNVKYSFEAKYNQTCYSSLVKGSSVCAGYAHGFQYLMQKVGIPCAYVLGYANGEYHAWNLVKLDGKHYAMDVTWDDPINAKKGRYYYNYFNVTDRNLSRDHVRADISASLPVAKGTACSYKNVFGGNQPGTDFDAIKGKLPKKKKR